MKKYTHTQKYSYGFVLVLIGLFTMTGCGEKTENTVAKAPAILEVGVVELKTESIVLTRELPGRTSAYRIAEVRARVNGIVQKRLFTEGDDVKEGQLLYQIDSAPYQAVFDSAKANLARAEAAAHFAQLQEERLKYLVSTNAVSQQDYDNAFASFQVAEADVAAAKAALQSADINLGYTKVISPIDGRIGLSEVTEGAYVQAGVATLMATVQQLDPIYVNLVQPSSEVLRLKHAFKEGTLKPDAASDFDDETGGTPVTLIMEDGIVYNNLGELQFSDVTVNRSTGSVTLRVLFPNPDMDLFPGVFVRARFNEATNPQALLVPQLGVGRNYSGEATVWVVVDGKAEIRVIKTDRTYGDQWVVTAGLDAGDEIIVTNLQRLRPNTPVTTVPWQPKKG